MLDFKRGDRVMVRDNNNDEWQERIYLVTIKGSFSPYLTVNIVYEEQFADGKHFLTSDWIQIKPIKKHNMLNIIYDIFTVLVGVMATIALGVIIYGIIKTT